MEIVIFKHGDERPLVAVTECIFIVQRMRYFMVYHMKPDLTTNDVDTLGEFNKQENAELFARAYVDSLTFVTFDEVLREALTEVKDLLPDVYEAYTQQYKSALKKYKELRPLENTGKADLAQIIVSANVFQRKLQKFINKNIHFLD